MYSGYLFVKRETSRHGYSRFSNNFRPGGKFLHSWQADQSLRQAAFDRLKDQPRVSQPAMYPHQVPIRRATLAG